MNRMWLVLALAVVACSKAQLPIVPEVKTTLQVKAIDQNGLEIDSVRVFLNGELVGLTPFKSEKIPSGLHALRLMKSGFQVFTDELFILEGQFYSVEALLDPVPPSEGQLVITVNQDSAVVMVMDANDNVVLRTEDRASSHMLVPGAYIISAEKDGLDPVVKAVDIIAGQAIAVNLEFNVSNTDLSLEFSIAEDSVQLGDVINLNWQSNGYQVIIDQGIGVRGPNGSERIVCASPGLKVFTATAYRENNFTTEKRDTVYIAPRSVTPPTLEFSANPDTLVFGDAVRIEWQSDGYQVVIDQGVGMRGPAGSEDLYFRNPGQKIFTATAYGNDNLLTTERDSVFIKEAPMPARPVIMLSTTRLVEVNSPANITWISQNADYVVVDFVPNAQQQGSENVTFSSPGIRMVTATAYNQAGYTSATDTIEVAESQVAAVDDIIISAKSSVRADRGESGYVDANAATFEIETPGKYRVYAKVWYNSGDSQLNESFYLEIRDAFSNVKSPRNPNAGRFKVVPDDPGVPHTKLRRSGDFQLSAGSHAIDVYHYAKIANTHPMFLNGQIDGPESVKILGFKLVYLE